MRLSFSNSLVDEPDLQKTADRVLDYCRRVKALLKEEAYAMPESFINLPGDGAVQDEVTRLVEEKKEKTRIVVLVGIGGSNLGAKAIYDALVAQPDAEKRLAQMIFVDAVDPEHLEKLEAVCRAAKDPHEIAVAVVGKSGRTLETGFNSEAVLAMLEEQFGEVAFERFIIVSDRESPLWKKAKERGAALIEIPQGVGGRFSVFSAVGLLPLALAHVDIKKLRHGGLASREDCLSDDAVANPALRSAAFLFFHAEHGRTIHDIFLTHPELESLGKWYRGLLAESLGKEGKGITPTVSLGTIDLHSVGQLMQGGPRDKTIGVVSVEKSAEGPRLKKKLFLSGDEEAKLIAGKSARELSAALLLGMKQSYRESGIPFYEVALPEMNEYSLGGFMMYKMMEVVWLSHLFGVNGFDAPDVLGYKRHAAEALKKQGNEV